MDSPAELPSGGREACCPRTPRSTALITLNASKSSGLHTVRLEVTSHNKLLEPQIALLAPLVGEGLIFPVCPRASTISYRSCILVLKKHSCPTKGHFLRRARASSIPGLKCPTNIFYDWGCWSPYTPSPHTIQYIAAKVQQGRVESSRVE